MSAPALGNFRQLKLVPAQSLAAHVSTVDSIIAMLDKLEDDEQLAPDAALTAETRDALSEQLIEAIAGTKEKIDNTTRVLALFEALEDAAAKEQARLAKRAARYARQRERLERYVLAVLEASNLARIDGHTSAVSVRKNPPAVVIDEPAALPIEFMRTPPTPAPQPDKSLIKSAILAGVDVPGCRLDRASRLVRS